MKRGKIYILPNKGSRALNKHVGRWFQRSRTEFSPDYLVLTMLGVILTSAAALVAILAWGLLAI